MNARKIAGLLVGAVAGLLLGGVVYSLGAPVLERSGGWLRETQGLLWNLVPLLTVLGALVGVWVAGRAHHH